MTHGRAGHERLRRANGRAVWAAAVLTIVAHAAILFLSPTFNVAGEARMVITVGPWSPPARESHAPGGYASLDTASMRLSLRNATAVNHRIPRLYPHLMWHHREPAWAQLQLSVAPSGSVRDVVLLAGANNGAEPALVELARMMQFDVASTRRSAVEVGARGLVATVEVGVVPR